MILEVTETVAHEHPDQLPLLARHIYASYTQTADALSHLVDDRVLMAAGR
jgi:hypothetical protein